MSQTTGKSPPRPTVYDSGVDLWLAMLLISAPLFSAVAGVYLLVNGQQGDAAILFIAGVATLVVTGCAGNRLDAADLPATEFAGHYAVTQGGSWFRP